MTDTGIGTAGTERVSPLSTTASSKVESTVVRALATKVAEGWRVEGLDLEVCITCPDLSDLPSALLCALSDTIGSPRCYGQRPDLVELFEGSKIWLPVDAPRALPVSRIEVRLVDNPQPRSR